MKALISDIIIYERVRPLDDLWVQALCLNISENGLRDPITVRHDYQKRVVLVDGLHRLEALKRLDIPEVEVLVFSGDAGSANLAEVEAHLLRSDLRPLDRAVAIARWREFYEAQNGRIQRGGDRKSANYQDKIKAKSFRFDFEELSGADNCEAGKKSGHEKTAQSLEKIKSQSLAFDFEAFGLGISSIKQALSIARMGNEAISRLRVVENNHRLQEPHWQFGQADLYKLSRVSEHHCNLVIAALEEGESFSSAWQLVFSTEKVRQGDQAIAYLTRRFVDLAPGERLEALGSCWVHTSKSERARFIAKYITGEVVHD